MRAQSPKHAFDGVEVRCAVLVLICSLLSFTGCGQSKQNAPPAVAARPTTAATAAVPVEKPSVPEPPPEEKTPEKPPTPAAAVAAPRERFAILTPGGPLLVDAAISIDGRPLNEFQSEPVAKPDAAASDSDAAADSDDEAPSDSEPDAEKEAGDPAAPARPFAIRSSRAYVPDPRASSRVWPLLDADGDGRLSTEEIDAAAERLWSRDAEDDRVIARAELAPLRDQLDGAAAATLGRRTAAGPAGGRVAALLLEEKTDFDRVEFVLQDLYAPRQDLTAESFHDLPRLFAQLDLGDDGWLDRDELKKMRTVPPQLELAVAFNRPETADHPAATVSVVRNDTEITVLPGATPDRVLLALGGTRLAISAHDMAPNEPDGPPADAAIAATAVAQKYPDAPATLVRLVVHDRGDVVFEELDVNGDGRLGEREIADAPRRLRIRDANADGQLVTAEAPYRLTMAFLRGESEGSRLFTTPPPSTPTGDAKQGPPWFASADLNHDGDVSLREFLGAAEQFAALDANGDGFIDPAEAATAAARRK
jgi:hypothetical protein